MKITTRTMVIGCWIASAVTTSAQIIPAYLHETAHIHSLRKLTGRSGCLTDYHAGGLSGVNPKTGNVHVTFSTDQRDSCWQAWGRTLFVEVDQKGQMLGELHQGGGFDRQSSTSQSADLKSFQEYPPYRQPLDILYTAIEKYTGEMDFGQNLDSFWLKKFCRTHAEYLRRQVPPARRASVKRLDTHADCQALIKEAFAQSLGRPLIMDTTSRIWHLDVLQSIPNINPAQKTALYGTIEQGGHFYVYGQQLLSDKSAPNTPNTAFIIEQYDLKTKKMLWRNDAVQVKNEPVQDGRLNPVIDCLIEMDSLENTYVVFRRFDVGCYKAYTTPEIAAQEGIKAFKWQPHDSTALTVVKYDKMGRLVWRRDFLDKTLYPNYTDFNIQVDALGNCFLYGRYLDTKVLEPLTSYDTSMDTARESFFLAKIDPTGTILLKLDMKGFVHYMLPDEQGGLWVERHWQNSYVGEGSAVFHYVFKPSGH